MIKQQKKGRPRSKNPMVHTAVVLPSELLDRLKKETSGRGLSAEIRHRLQQTYGPARDRETDRLLKVIGRLAYSLAGDLGEKWYEHPYAFAAFKAGVEALLSRSLPEGDQSKRPNAAVGQSDDPPEVVGRTHARLVAKRSEAEEAEEEKYQEEHD